MVTLSEADTNIRTAKSNIAQARQQSEQAEETLSEAKKKLPEVRSQQALRQKFTGLQGRTARQKVIGAETEIIGKQGEVQKYKEEVIKYEEEVKQAEKELEEYKYTPAGRLQYAKEMGLKPSPQKSYLDRPYYNYALMSVPVYETPYGDVADTTNLDKAKAEAYRTEAKIASMGGITAYQFGKTQEQLAKLGEINIKDVKPVDVKSFLAGAEVKLGDTTLKMDTTTGTINAVTQRLDRTTRMQEGFLKPALEINPATGREYGVLSAVETPSSRLDRFQAYIQQKRGEAKTQELRGEGNFKTGATLFFGGIGSSLVGSSQFARNFVNSPIQTTKSILVGGKEAFKKAFITGEGFPMVSAMILEEPQYLTGYAVAEVAQARAGGAITALAKEKIITASTKLSPKYSVFDEGIKLKSGVEIKEAGGLKNLRTPLTEQVKIAGQTINAVSAQRDLFGLIDNTKIVRKPIPNEASLTSETKELLKQFDEGKLQASKLSELNKRIIAETGSKGLLERSFFADPYGRIRVSRLGVLDNTQKKASMLDVLSEDVTTKKSKPQIILFENVRVADFPKSLSDVKKALLEGKSLTPSQQNRLLEWQLTRDILQNEGQFKPIGFISQEPEVILSPNTLIKKQNTPAVTLINNKRVEVIKAEIISTPDKIQKLINKKNSVGLTSAENTKLSNLLESSTGLSYVQSESPYFDIGSKTIGAGISILSSSKTSSKPIETISYNVLGISPTSSKPSIEVYNKPSYKVSELGSPNISPVPESPKKYDLSFDFKKPKEYKEPISPPPRTPTYSPPVIKPPRIKPPIKEREERFFNAKQKIKEIASEMFSVFKRSKGQDVFVGKAPTEYSAFEKLKRELKKDTSASGFVERAGRGKVKALSFGDGDFRTAKKDIFRLVQKKGGREGGRGRLSTSSEIWDIKKQRNKKPDWFS